MSNWSELTWKLAWLWLAACKCSNWQLQFWKMEIIELFLIQINCIFDFQNLWSTAHTQKELWKLIAYHKTGKFICLYKKNQVRSTRLPVSQCPENLGNKYATKSQFSTRKINSEPRQTMRDSGALCKKREAAEWRRRRWRRMLMHSPPLQPHNSHYPTHSSPAGLDSRIREIKTRN